MFSPFRLHGCAAAIGVCLMSLGMLPAPAATAQGINLARYCDVSGSTPWSGYGAQLAVDGVVSNAHRFVSDDSNTTHELIIELGDEFEIGSANLFFGADDTNTVASFGLFYWDGASWIGIPGARARTNTETELQLIFAETVITDRVRFTSGQSGAVRIKEIALFPPNSGQGYPLDTEVEIEVAIAPAVTANSQFDNTLRPINATDGYIDDDSRWTSAWDTNGHELVVDFARELKVASVHLYTGWDNNPANAISNFHLEYADPNGAWIQLPETVTTNNSTLDLVFNLNNTVDAKQFKLVTPDAFVRVREICFFPPNGGVNYPLGFNVKTDPKPYNQWPTYEDNLYTIESRLHGKPLDASHGNLHMYDKYADPSQQFMLLYVWDTDAFRIVNKDTWLCLQVDGASLLNGAAVELGEFRGRDWQLWQLVPSVSDTYKLVNVHSGLALQIYQDSTANGATLVQAPLASRPAQDWHIVYHDHFPKKGVARSRNRPHYVQNLIDLGANHSNNWGLTAAKPGQTYPWWMVHMPMKWGNGLSSWQSYQQWLPGFNVDKPTILEGFNEPSHTDQSNIPVDDAIYSWTRMEAAKMPIASPAPDWFGNSWMSGSNGFWNNMTAQGMRCDYFAFHLYRTNLGTDGFMNSISSAYNRYQRPLMITEWGWVNWNGPAPWSDKEIYTQFAEVLYRMELVSYLARYTVFLFDNGWKNGSPSALLQSDDLTLKPLGILYAAWDGDTTLRSEQAYYIHNQASHTRLKTGAGTVNGTAITDHSPNTEWYLTPIGGDRYYINSIGTGERLALDPNSALIMVAGNLIGSELEWRVIHNQHGWHYIQHAGGGRLTITNGRFGTFNSGNPTDTTAKFRFIKPIDPCPVAGADANLDGDHDVHDFAELQACTGAFGAGCEVFDYHYNGEIDFSEFEDFFCFDLGPSPYATAWHSETGFDGTWNLGSANTEQVTVAFDIVTFDQSRTNAVVGYADSSTNVTTYSSNAVLVRMYQGVFDAYDLNTYAADTSIPFTAGEVYHVRIEINVPAETYDVFITPPGETEVQLANDFVFRSSAPGTNDIGQVTLITQGSDGDFVVYDHTMNTQ